MSDSLWPHGLQSTRLLCPWESPGKNTGVGCHFLLPGIFLTQELNPRLESPALAGSIFTTSATFPLSRLRSLLGLGRWERDGRLNDGQHQGWGLRDAEHLLHWQLDSLQLAPPEQPLKTWVYANSLIQMEGMIRNCLQYPPLFTEAPR